MEQNYSQVEKLCIFCSRFRRFRCGASAERRKLTSFQMAAFCRKLLRQKVSHGCAGGFAPVVAALTDLIFSSLAMSITFTIR